MKQQLLKSLLGTSLTCASFVLHAQTVPAISFGNQTNTGIQTATLSLNNIVVTDSKLNLSALGNVISVTAEKDTINLSGPSGLTDAVQTNSGTQNTIIQATGQLTNLSNNTINGAAIGNVQSYSATNTAQFANGIQTGLKQNNSGNQNSTFTWAQDPTTNLELNLTAIGNVQSFSMK